MRFVKTRVPSRPQVCPECSFTFLSSRHRQVLGVIAGRSPSNKEIANILVISPKTVARYIENLLVKLEVENRGQAIIWAWEHGFGQRNCQDCSNFNPS